MSANAIGEDHGAPGRPLKSSENVQYHTLFHGIRYGRFINSKPLNKEILITVLFVLWCHVQVEVRRLCDCKVFGK